MLPWYATREAVARATDVKASAHAWVQIDRGLDAGSRRIESLCHRKFYPQVATRYFAWPDYENGSWGRPWQLWLGDNELISLTSLTSNGAAVPLANIYLEPVNTGPPYTRIELDRASSAAFSGATGPQRAIAVTGVFGYTADEILASELAEALDSSETEVDVTDSPLIGVGALLRIGTERMIVTGRSMLTTGQTLQTPLAAMVADVTVAVTTGSAYSVDEILLLDSERMLIVDIAGNQLTVKRAWDGTVLAAHTGSTIYAARTLTVERGVLGTTAATHLAAAPIYRHAPPGLVRDLCIALAMDSLAKEGAGYAQTAGTKDQRRGQSSDSRRPTTGTQLSSLVEDVYTTYGRQYRMSVI